MVTHTINQRVNKVIVFNYVYENGSYNSHVIFITIFTNLNYTKEFLWEFKIIFVIHFWNTVLRLHPSYIQHICT
jgi:hypothetical protein